jgi:hypothetical protein
MPLFGDRMRTNLARRRPGEDWFAFLERVGPSRYFARLRQLVDTWFDELPTEQQKALRPRLMSRDDATSMSAFWELYLHAALLRSGLEMEYEPPLDRSTRRPDYLVRDGGGGSFYLEAVLVGDPEHRKQEDKLEEPITEALRALDSSQFTVDFQIRKRGASSPKLGPVKAQVRRWLADLDREEIMRRHKEHGRARVQPLLVRAGDWLLNFSPIPRPDSLVGTSSAAGAISIFPGRTAWGGDWSRVHAALEEKARRYGDLDRPFVMALLTNDVFVDEENIAAALHGEPAFAAKTDSHFAVGRVGGLWGGGGGSRVSAVLTARNLVPASVAVVELLLWRAPRPRRPLDSKLPFPSETSLTAEGEIAVNASKPSTRDYFGLPAQWPGPEQPFRD